MTPREAGAIASAQHSDFEDHFPHFIARAATSVEERWGTSASPRERQHKQGSWRSETPTVDFHTTFNAVWKSTRGCRKARTLKSSLEWAVNFQAGNLCISKALAMYSYIWIHLAYILSTPCTHLAHIGSSSAINQSYENTKVKSTVLTLTLTFTLTFKSTFTLTFTSHLQIDRASSHSIGCHCF